VVVGCRVLGMCRLRRTRVLSTSLRLQSVDLNHNASIKVRAAAPRFACLRPGLCCIFVCVCSCVCGTHCSCPAAFIFCRRSVVGLFYPDQPADCSC
jgi:hypothetical protein